MAEQTDPHFDDTEFRAERDIDRICDRFEASLGAGQDPRIEDYLHEVSDAHRRALFESLLLVEIDLLRKNGQCPTVGDYKNRFPSYAREINRVFSNADTTVDLRSQEDTPGVMASALDASQPSDPVGNSRKSRTRFPRSFGNYELLEELGRGGMGVVYRARQRQPERIVALKMIITGGLATDEAVQRFYSEANAAAKLQHPHIVPVFEVGQFEGHHFFSMAFVEGDSLADMLSDKAVSAHQAAAYVEKIAKAIHYAHQQGILHRDIKPANILIDERDEPLVTDFGLAKCIDEDVNVTRTDQIIGTPSYMPPEQASSVKKNIGPYSDTYALGALLYALLTGRPPFKADTIARTLLQVTRDEPVRPRLLNSQIPRDLETIALKCLEKEPDRRYTAADELAFELGRYLRGEPIKARPIGRVGRTWRWCKRKPGVATLSAGVIMLLSGILIAAPVVAWREAGLRQTADRRKDEADDARKDAEQATTKEKKARRRAERAKADEQIARQKVERLLARQYVSRAFQLSDRNDHAGAMVWATAALKLDDPNRSLVHRRRIASFAEQLPKLLLIGRHNGSLTDLKFSPDGKALVSTGWDNTARLWRVDRPGDVGHVLLHDAWVLGAAISRDGRHVATIAADGSAHVWRLSDGNPIGKPLKHADPVTSVVFHPSGLQLATASGERYVAMKQRRIAGPMRHMWVPGRGGIMKRVPIAGKPIDTYTPIRGKTTGWTWNRETKLWDRTYAKSHPGWITHLEFSHDGDRLLVTGASMGGKRQVVALTAATGEPLGAAIIAESNVSQGRFLAEGKKVLIGTGNDNGVGRPQLWTLGDPPKLEKEFAPMVQVVAVGVDPEENNLIAVSRDGIARSYSIDTGKSVSSAKIHSDGVTTVGFSQDGELMATACEDGTARVWRTPSLQPMTGSLKHFGPVNAVAISPSGNLLATGGRDGLVKVWDIAARLRQRPTFVHSHIADWSGISTNGNYLATVTGRYASLVRQFKGGFSTKSRFFDRKGFVLWNARTGKKVWSAGSADGDSTSAQFTVTRQTVLVRMRDKTDSKSLQLHLVNLEHGAHRVLPIDGKDASATAITPDAKWLATWGRGKPVQIWDTAGATKPVAKIDVGDDVRQLDIDPIGKRIAVIKKSHAICMYDIASGKMVGKPMSHEREQLRRAFSADGKRLVTLVGPPDLRIQKDGFVRVWNVETGEPLTDWWQLHDAVTTLALDSTGERLLIAGENGRVQLRSVPVGRQLIPTVRHRGAVNSVQFSPDETMFLTAGDDGVARVWDVSTGEAITPQWSHPASVRHASFSPDGDQVVTACGDGKVRIWPFAHDNRDVADLVKLSEMFSGEHLDETVGLSPIEPAELVRRFKEFKYPTAKDSSRNDTETMPKRQE